MLYVATRFFLFVFYFSLLDQRKVTKENQDVDKHPKTPAYPSRRPLRQRRIRVREPQPLPHPLRINVLLEEN